MKIDEIIERCSQSPSSVYEPEQRMWYRLIKDLPGKPVIVDFGTGWAKSACSLALSCPQGTVYTFDNGLPHINKNRTKKQYIKEVKGYIAKSGAENVDFIFGSSLEVPWDKEIDVLNIDSDHTYEHAKAELNRWIPFVKTGGHVFLHDWEHPRCPGVRQAFDELVPSKFNLKFIEETKSGEIKCAYFKKL